MAKATEKKKAPAKKPATPKKEPIEKVSMAELFAYEYIQNKGNATAAAKKVFNTKNDNSAHSLGCTYLRKVAVQTIIREHLVQVRAGMDSFALEQGDRLSAVAKFYRSVMEDEKQKVEKRFDAAEQLARLSGFEISHALDYLESKRIDAGAEASRAATAAKQTTPGGGPVDNSRRTIFMLSPPPVPPGGVPSPALARQWEEMGFRPGVALPLPDEDNANDGTIAHSSPGGK